MGTGDAAVQAGDSIEVRYTGWLMKDGAFGKEFDGNATKDKPFRFKVGKGKVIAGWDAGVVSMKRGGVRFLGIPAAQGYGAQGVPDRIPANTYRL